MKIADVDTGQACLAKAGLRIQRLAALASAIDPVRAGAIDARCPPMADIGIECLQADPARKMSGVA